MFYDTLCKIGVLEMSIFWSDVIQSFEKWGVSMLTYDLIVIGFGKAGKTWQPNGIGRKKLLWLSEADYVRGTVSISPPSQQNSAGRSWKGLTFDKLWLKECCDQPLSRKNTQQSVALVSTASSMQAHFLSIRSSKSQLVMKEELTAETVSSILVLFSNVLPIPGPRETELSMTPLASKIWRNFLSNLGSGWRQHRTRIRWTQQIG